MSDELTVVVDKADEATEVIEQTVKTTQQGIVDETGIPSGYYQDANGRWYRPNGEFASNTEVGITSPEKIAAGSHGNSLSDPRTNYGYDLRVRGGNSW